MSRSTPQLYALVTYTKRTAEIQAFQRCKACLGQVGPSYLKLTFKERASNLCCVAPYSLHKYGSTQHKFEARSLQKADFR
jgi:hypothetical protein